MIARRVIVRGVVQGVGYRYAMIETAKALQLAGWVRNRHDGTVEAFAQGTTEAVTRLIDWARRGPPAARVSHVEVVEAEVDEALGRFDLYRSE
jgi:acylphosphatase